MRYIILILSASLILSSCSFYEAPARSVEVQGTVTVEASASERQALYVYGQKVNSKEVTLYYGGDPLPLSCGYVKLVGAVRGRKSWALLEIGGKGSCFALGDKVGDYRIVEINEKEVKLCLEE